MTGHDQHEPDTQAAIEVIRLNGADLLSYLARRTRIPADAADVLGNVLVVIWNRRQHLPRAATEARMWTFGIARNALREYRRQGAKQLALADALREDLQRLLSEPDTDPLEVLHRTQRNKEVQSAVAGLAKLDRELIMLVHWDDFTLAHAAAMLDMNPSTARTRYARARQRLAAELAHHSGAANVPRSERIIRLPRAVEDLPESSP